MRGKMCGLAILIVSLAALCPISAQAVSWTIADIGTDAWLPSTITFAFDGYNLLLNNAYIYQPGGSSAYNLTLRLSGTWGACGSVSASGELVPDPYATFVIVRPDENALPSREVPNEMPLPRWVDVWDTMGYVSWSPDTPHGYTTSLILGGQFGGDGAGDYVYQNDQWYQEATGTMVLDSNWHYWGGYYGGHTYTPQAYTLNVTHLPEPAPIAIILSGLGALLLRRTRRA